MASFLAEKKILSTVQQGTRYAPGGEDIIKRVGLLCGLSKGERALVWDCSRGTGALYLAKKYGCVVTCVEDDSTVLAELAKKCESESIEDLVVGTTVEPFDFEESDQEFMTFFAEVGFRCVKQELEKIAECGWQLLVPEGMLALMATVRVGRVMPAAVHAYYSKRGYELPYPGELVQWLENKGFEPLALESLGESSMFEWYRSLERSLKAEQAISCSEVDFLKREIEIFRREGGRTCVDVVLFVGKRKELAAS